MVAKRNSGLFNVLSDRTEPELLKYRHISFEIVCYVQFFWVCNFYYLFFQVFILCLLQHFTLFILKHPLLCSERKHTSLKNQDGWQWNDDSNIIMPCLTSCIPITAVFASDYFNLKKVCCLLFVSGRQDYCVQG